MNFISSNGLSLLKKYEGYSSNPYWDFKQWSIGYGSFAGSYKKDAKPSLLVTPASASVMLIKQLQPYVKNILSLIKVKLNQNQFDALVLFTYNLGSGILSKSSSTFGVSLLTDLNNMNFVRFAERMKRYDKVNDNGVWKVNEGLVKRREAEIKLFLTGLSVQKKVINNSPSGITVLSPGLKYLIGMGLLYGISKYFKF